MLCRQTQPLERQCNTRCRAAPGSTLKLALGRSCRAAALAPPTQHCCALVAVPVALRHLLQADAVQVEATVAAVAQQQLIVVITRAAPLAHQVVEEVELFGPPGLQARLTLRWCCGWNCRARRQVHCRASWFAPITSMVQTSKSLNKAHLVFLFDLNSVKHVAGQRLVGPGVRGATGWQPLAADAREAGLTERTAVLMPRPAADAGEAVPAGADAARSWRISKTQRS